MRLERHFKRGDTVIVRKGAVVKSLHPKKGTYTLKRNQKVIVHLVLHGYEYEGEKRLPEISWAGTGGYWCYVNQSDII